MLNGLRGDSVSELARVNQVWTKYLGMKNELLEAAIQSRNS